MSAPARRYCPHCAYGSHRSCSGQAPALGGSCECADRDHNPDVQTAAVMRLYQRPDLSKAKLPIEELATQWRKITG